MFKSTFVLLIVGSCAGIGDRSPETVGSTQKSTSQKQGKEMTGKSMNVYDLANTAELLDWLFTEKQKDPKVTFVLPFSVRYTDQGIFGEISGAGEGEKPIAVEFNDGYLGIGLESILSSTPGREGSFLMRVGWGGDYFEEYKQRTNPPFKVQVYRVYTSKLYTSEYPPAVSIPFQDGPIKKMKGR